MTVVLGCFRFFPLFSFLFSECYSAQKLSCGLYEVVPASGALFPYFSRFPGPVFPCGGPTWARFWICLNKDDNLGPEVLRAPVSQHWFLYWRDVEIFEMERACLLPLRKTCPLLFSESVPKNVNVVHYVYLDIQVFRELNFTKSKEMRCSN